jgi:hypothetical protein
MWNQGACFLHTMARDLDPRSMLTSLEYSRLGRMWLQGSDIDAAL